MIAVDAMGGDYAPKAVVRGSFLAAKKGIPVTLFGIKKTIHSILDTCATNWSLLPITVVDCSQTIQMDEEPSRAILRKKDSSLVQALHFVKDGKCDAVLSAGNSGAVVVASTLILGRVPGLLRPAIGGFLPTVDYGSIFCLDLGGNADCKPEYLKQFALMGSLYLQLTKNIASPRVALLSNGHEPYKGSLTVKKAYSLLLDSGLCFVGNMEARDVFSGKADVLISDGFGGNILLKAAQGMSQTIMDWLKSEARASWWNACSLWLSRSVFRRIKANVDYAQAGGALLLGIEKPVVLAHGCSNERAITNAILFCHTLVHEKQIEKFNKQLRCQLDLQDQKERMCIKEKSIQREV